MRVYTDEELMSKTEEIWEYVEMSDIVRLRYKVSNKARVYDTKRGVYLQGTYNHRNGFLTVNLRKRSGAYKGFMIHRLVFQVFKPKEFAESVENKWQIRHVDGNVRINDLYNLEAAPRSVVRAQRTQEISKILDPNLVLVKRTNVDDIDIEEE